jgi:hypothetical protein
VTEEEIRRDERRKCSDELRSFAEAHLACAVDNDVSEEVTALHKAKAETVAYCAQRLLDWASVDPAA